MGNAQAETYHYLPKNRFRLRFDGEVLGEFTTANGINAGEFAKMEIHTGESNVAAAQSPGKKKFDDLVLTKGATLDEKLYAWWLQVGDEAGQNGDIDPQYKRTVELDQLDRDGTPLITWTYYEAFPVKFNEGDFDANASEFRMVSVTIAYRYNHRKVAQT